MREETPFSYNGSIWLALACLSFNVVLISGCGGTSSTQAPPGLPPSFTISATPPNSSMAPGTTFAIQVAILSENGFDDTVSVGLSGMPSGLTVTPSSFTLQRMPQTVTLAAATSLANGNYPLSVKGTSGNLANTATISVTVEAPEPFSLIQPTVLEAVTRIGSATSVPLQTTICCSAGATNYLVNFSTKGLPAGVSASFSPNPVAPGAVTSLTLSTSTGLQWIQNLPIEVVATPNVSVPTEDLDLDLVVAPQPGNIPNNRSGYLRTDDTPQSIVYDSAHQFIFSSDYGLNRVDVVSTSSRKIVRSVPVLTPRGLALSMDATKVLVGSDGQRITAISTTSLQVVQRWDLPRVSGASYGPRDLFPLSNGNVLIHYSELNGGLWQIAIWDPQSNSISSVATPGALEPCYVAANTTGSKIIISDCSSSGKTTIYDVSGGVFGPTINLPDFVYGLAASPDGSHFVIYDLADGVVFYNDQLQAVVGLAAPGDVTGFVFSSDGTRLYVVGGFGVPLIATFDGNTGAFVRTAPAIGTIPPGTLISPSPFVETPYAVNSSGIIFGSADHGIAFDDSNYAASYILGFNATPPFVQTVTPDAGPINSETQVSFPEGNGFGFLPDVWFGSARGLQASLNESGVLTVSAPPSSVTGPVDVKVMQPDGTPIFDPQAFSYGPAPMFVNGDIASPTGGATVHLVGVGLPTDPSQIQISVGGKSAAVTSATAANVRGLWFPFAYPYPAVDVQFALPPGSGTQDLEVTTPAGSASLPKAIHYAQSVTDYSSPDKFQSIAFDRSRNQLYLSAGDHIDVFSIVSKQFLTPISPPALNGQKAFHGLAMAPNDSALMAANFADGSVAVINPDQPSSATAVQIIPSGTFGSPGPENLVTTQTGKVLIEPMSTQEEGCGGTFYQLDLSTLHTTPVANIGSFCIQPEGFPIAASADGSKVLIGTTDISGDQQLAIYDAVTATWMSNFAVGDNFGPNAAVNSDGSVFSTGNGIVNANADLIGYLSYWDVFESGLSFSLPLEKIDVGGGLVFVPYSSFVDIFDVNHGARMNRITLTEQVQKVTDAMIIDPTGQSLYLITNAGLTVVQLNSAPLAIGGISPAAGPLGTVITIRGSGFLPTTSVSINGSVIAPVYVDANHLQARVQGGFAGATQITVANPDGTNYTLDAAFMVQ